MFLESISILKCDFASAGGVHRWLGIGAAARRRLEGAALEGMRPPLVEKWTAVGGTVHVN